MVQDSPSRKQDQFIVRLPDGMRDRIKAAAEASNRSMNAEIVATLEEKYPAPADPQSDLFEFFLEAYEAKLNRALGAGDQAAAERFRMVIAQIKRDMAL